MSPRVLIVEDTVAHRDALQQFLQQQQPKWLFYSADNEGDGIRIIDEQLAKQEGITVLLTDLGLNRSVKDDKGGFRVIAAARERDPSIIAILYSVLSDLDRNEAFTLGSFDVVERNVAGIATAKEILLKTETALRYRESLDRVRFLSSFIDKSLIHTIDENPNLLKLQKRMATVCFWDIQGFSRCCEELIAKPELIADFLRDYCQEAAKTIFANRGVLDKFIGDGVMALFGVLEPSGSNDYGATAAAEAALSMRVSFEELIRQREEVWTFAANGRNVQIGLRCGIHTGEAMIGCTGTDFRDQFTALGASVNLASRIEGEADGTQRQILVSSSVKKFLGPKYKLSKVKTIGNVKNIQGSFDLYSLEHN